MNFTKSLKRNNFVEVDCFSSQISSSHQPRSRCGRDPFEGDPFKIQSLNFHYADKPSYPISNRGKGQAGVDKSQVKNIYYNHDHTIPKCNKENLPLGHSRQMQQFNNPVRKSSSFRSVSVASKTFSTDKACLESNSMSQQSSAHSRSQQLRRDSQESLLHRARSSMAPREVQSNRSKPCICIPNMITKSSSTSQQKSYSKPTMGHQSTMSTLSSASAPVVVHKRSVKSRSDVSEQLTDIDVNHTGSCHVTIKINGVPKNRVHISKNRNNVEINLTKPKKSKKSPKSPKVLSPHAIKPSKSYVIHRDEPTASRNTDLTRSSELSRNDMKESSTLSMIPHREEKQHTPLETRQASSIPTISDTIRAYTGIRSGSASRTSIPARNNFEKHAAMLEKILSNNPIVLQPKGRILFTRSKPPLSRKCSSTGMPSSYVFDKMNSQAC